jgi:hypothetical protein
MSATLSAKETGMLAVLLQSQRAASCDEVLLLLERKEKTMPHSIDQRQP